MTGRRAPRQDSGYTLVEVLIAMLILGIAVGALVLGLTSLMTYTREGRAHAIAETTSRSFSQAVMAQAQSGTVLISIDNNDIMTVQQPDLLPPATSQAADDYYVAIEREVLRVTERNANGTFDVDRNVNDELAAVETHTGTPKVVPVLRCPGAAFLTPPASMYEGNVAATPTITAVQYWSDTNDGWFANQAACLAAFDAKCETRDSPPEARWAPECSDGYFRVLINVPTTDDRYNNVDNVKISTQTDVIVRQGSV